jgi:hypothetical protein
MRAALITPHENVFRAHDAILVADGLDLAFFLSEPGHMKQKSEIRSQLPTRNHFLLIEH